MRKIHTLLLLISLVACGSFCFAGQAPGKLMLSEKEKAGISTAVKKETDQAIISVTRESQDIVKVRTRKAGKVTSGRLEGGGTIFTFKRTKKGWEVQRDLTGYWVS